MVRCHNAQPPQSFPVLQVFNSLQAVAKPQSPASCHSERSEETNLFDKFYVLQFVQDDRKIGFATSSNTLYLFMKEGWGKKAKGKRLKNSQGLSFRLFTFFPNISKIWVGS
jgi:hypothetical protein